MPDLYDRRVRDSEFRQNVRRTAPSSLVPLVAAIGAQYPTPDKWIWSPYRKYTPWALAEIARTSLVFGNEHRRPAEPDDVLRACAAYVALSDPDLSAGGSDAFWKFMARISYEQLPDQTPVFNELSRSIALFSQTRTPRTLRLLAGNWRKVLLGCSIEEYVSTAFLLHVAALKNAGQFSLNWLTQANFTDIVAELPEATIRTVVDAEFVADIPEFVALDQGTLLGQHPDLRRHNFNPLQKRPVIRGLTPYLVIPSPGMLIRKASPLGIYHAGVERWGEQFTIETGYLFESYVGKLLELLPDAEVASAIKYGREGEESVDWFAIFDDVVLLVEVKATRSTQAIRTAGASSFHDLKQNLGRAVSQLSTTVKLIESRNAAFGCIPTDRPMVGLIVTMEPFHIVNSEYFRRELPKLTIPYLVTSAAELEDIVTCQSKSVGSVVLSHVKDEARDGWSLKSAFDGFSRTRNSVLESAWDSLLWGSRDRNVHDRA